MKTILVQHSGYGYGSNPEFIGGLEPRTVSKAQAEKLQTTHGITIYDSYGAASDAAEQFMYPEGYSGLIPVADKYGTFLRAKFDGLHLFKPHQSDAHEST